jgi:glycosyltransferase involved in cell wall biosynthesis
MSKVIFLLPSLRVNGGSVIFELINQLINKGHDVQITSLDELIPVDFFPLIVTPTPINQAQKLFLEADAIIAYYPVCAYYLNDIETKAKKFYLITEDQKVFYSKEVFKVNYPQLDEDRLEIEYDTQQKYIEKSYTLPFHYLTTNDDLTKTFKDYYKRKTITVPIGVNTQIYYPELIFLKDDAPRILVEGNLMPWKGLNEINEALSLLRGYQLWTLSDIKYTIKSDKHWQNLNPEQLRKVLSSCDILIRAYTEDGTAELQAQAMACGCVVLTRETSGSKMFCKDGINCLSYNKNEELENKLKTLLINKELRNQLISGGLETVKSLDWQNSVQVLEQVMGGKKYGKRRSTQSR